MLFLRSNYQQLNGKYLRLHVLLGCPMRISTVEIALFGKNVFLISESLNKAVNELAVHG